MRTYKGSVRMSGGAALMISAALMLTACGSSSKASSATTPAAGATATSTPTPGTPVSVPKVSTSGSFCDIAKREKALTDSSSTQSEALLSDTPAQIKAYFQQTLAEFTTITNKAPSSIKPSMQVLLNAYTGIYNALDAADFSFTKVNPTALESFSNASVTQATTTVDAYLAGTCGLVIASASPAS